MRAAGWRHSQWLSWKRMLCKVGGGPLASVVVHSCLLHQPLKAVFSIICMCLYELLQEHLASCLSQNMH